MEKVYTRQLIDNNLDQLLSWIINGYTIKEICENLKISTHFYYKIINNNEDLKLKIDKAKNICNQSVENSLYRRCLGYYVIEEKEIIELSDNGKKERKEKHKKYISPDSSCIQFWLKNRVPENWKNDVDLKLSENEGSGVTVINLIDEETGLIEEDIFNTDSLDIINRKSKIVFDNRTNKNDDD